MHIRSTEDLIAMCGLVMLIINTLMTIKAIRRHIPKKTIAVADIIISILMMCLWDKTLQHAEADAAYWIVYMEYFFLSAIGLVTLVIAVLSGKDK